MKLSELTEPTRIEKIIQLLRTATVGMVQPAASTIVEQYGPNPYLVLVSCILSLRTKDATSLKASQELFKHVTTPQQMVQFPLTSLEKIIYPVGFYRQKSKQIKMLSHELITRFDGKVPHTREELLALTGVGPKTASLVLGMAFSIPAICVDTHVHKVSNRLGIINTKTPAESEEALQKVIPQKYWIEFNQLIVTWGQNICVPISPLCSKCVLSPLCPKIGVAKRR